MVGEIKEQISQEGENSECVCACTAVEVLNIFSKWLMYWLFMVQGLLVMVKATNLPWRTVKSWRSACDLKCIRIKRERVQFHQDLS